MMDFASTFFGEVFTEAIGWFLLHSIWQGAILAILLVVARILLRNRSAQLRYYISYAALVLVLFSASFTFQKAYRYASEKAQLKETIINNPSYLGDQIRDNHNAGQLITSPKISNNIWLERIKLRSGLQVYFPWIVSIWIIGLLFYLLKVSGSLFYLLRIRNSHRLSLESKWINKTLEYCSLLKIKRKVGIHISANIKTTITLGFLKPLILVPASLVAGLSPEMLEAIIVHELAHIRRNDYLLNILQTLIETIFFYHPAVWYISSQIRQERELACDDIALGITSDRISYAKALSIAQEHALIPEDIALAFAPRKNTLLQRIKRLNTKITMKTNLFEKLTAGFLILSAFLFFSFIIDGNNTEIKDRDTSNVNVVDSLSEPKPDANLVIVHKTDSDSSGSGKIVRRVHSSDKEEIDSLITALHAYGGPIDEVEKMIEIVLSEPEIIEHEEIMRSIHFALDDIDMAEMEREMREAEKEMAAQVALLECENLMKMEHLKECDSLNSLIMISVKESMEIARAEMENLNLDSIMNEALLEADQKMAELDIDILVADAIKEAKMAYEAEQLEVFRMKIELDEKKMNLAEHEVRLKKREAELKEQLKELEVQLKEVKQRQKAESKKSE